MLLTEGTQAPEFTLPNQDEKNVSLSDFRGQKILLWFFPKASTLGWTVQGEGFRDEFNTFNQKNVQIIGVSADPPKKQKKFCDKYNFNFPMLCDEGHTMLEAYGVWQLKKFMGREYMGIVRMSYLINEEGKIEHVFDKVNTKTHANDVLNTL